MTQVLIITHVLDASGQGRTGGDSGRPGSPRTTSSRSWIDGRHGEVPQPSSCQIGLRHPREDLVLLDQNRVSSGRDGCGADGARAGEAIEHDTACSRGQPEYLTEQLDGLRTGMA